MYKTLQRQLKSSNTNPAKNWENGEQNWFESQQESTKTYVLRSMYMHWCM